MTKYQQGFPVNSNGEIVLSGTNQVVVGTLPIDMLPVDDDGRLKLGHPTMIVNTIADLKALSAGQFSSVQVLGYYAAGDGGGGQYYYDSSDTTSADNGGSIIVDNDGGRWKLVNNGKVTLRQFGAKGDGVNNDCDNFRMAIKYFKNIHIDDGTFLIAPTASSGDFMLYLGIADGKTDRSGLVITGNGEKSIIKLADNVGRNKLLFAGGNSDSLKNMTFKDFCIDLNGANNLQTSFADPLRYNCAFYFSCYCENLLFQNLHIKNGSGSQWIRVGNDTSVGYGKTIRVLNNKFENFGIGLPNNYQQDVSVCYVQADDILCEGNTFSCDTITFDLSRGHTAFELHCETATKVVNNTFKNLQLPILLASSQKNFRNVVVDGNTFEQTNYMVSLDGGTYDQKQVIISNNTYQSTVCKSSAIVPLGFSGEPVKSREDIVFEGNIVNCWNNVNLGVHLFYCDSVYLRSITIRDNQVGGLTGAILTFLGVVRNDTYAEIVVKNNRMDSLGNTSGAYPDNPAFVHIETSSGTINTVEIDGNVLMNSADKNYSAFGCYKISGAIKYVFVDRTDSIVNEGYPLVTDGVTNYTKKIIESSIEKPVDYRTGYVTVPAGGSLNLFDFAPFTLNENALLDVKIWISVGGSSNGTVLHYSVLKASAANIATLLASGGAFVGDVTLNFSGTMLRLTSTYGSNLSALVCIKGLSTQPIQWLV